MNGQRGAVFDWDGVIINSAAHHEASWERLARELGRVLPAGHFERGFGMRNQVIIPELLEWTRDEKEIESIALRKEVLYREIVKERGIDALPGVTPWLQRLRDAGVPCAIASSTHRENITLSLDVLGLKDFFPVIVASEDVTRGKPDPEVFLIAARRLGSPPANSVVFEDALVGLQAAHAAKMRVVAVTTTLPRERLGQADRIVDRLDELAVADLWPASS